MNVQSSLIQACMAVVLWAGAGSS
ncbi:MAG: hypothetical protein RL706_1358, partial [Pseudomonadota bacterium]